MQNPMSQMFNPAMMSNVISKMVQQQMKQLPPEQQQIFKELEIRCIKRTPAITIEVKYMGQHPQGPQAAENMLNSMFQQLPSMLGMFGAKVKVYE